MLTVKFRVQYQEHDTADPMGVLRVLSGKGLWDLYRILSEKYSEVNGAFVVDDDSFFDTVEFSEAVTRWFSDGCLVFSGGGAIKVIDIGIGMAELRAGIRTILDSNPRLQEIAPLVVRIMSYKYTPEEEEDQVAQVVRPIHPQVSPNSQAPVLTERGVPVAVPVEDEVFPALTLAIRPEASTLAINLTVLPLLVTPGSSKLDEALAGAPEAVRKSLTPNDITMAHLVNINERIRVSPDSPGESNTLTVLVDALYPRMGNVTLAGIIPLAIEAIKDCLFVDPVINIESSGGSGQHSIFNGDTSFNFLTSNSSSSSSLKGKISFSIYMEETTTGITLKLNNPTTTGDTKKVKAIIPSIEATAEKFINDLVSPSMLPNLLVALIGLTTERNSHYGSGYFPGVKMLELIETRVSKSSNGMLEESVPALTGVSEMDLVKLSLVANILSLTSSGSLGGCVYGLADKLAPVTHNPKVPELELLTQISAYVCTEILLRCAPVLSAICCRIAYNMGVAIAREHMSGTRGISSITYSPCISPNGPHLLIRMKSKKQSGTVAIPVVSLISVCYSSHSTADPLDNVTVMARRRLKDLMDYLAHPMARKLAGITVDIKDLLLIADPPTPASGGFGHRIYTPGTRALLENKFGENIVKLSNSGTYIVSSRKPLSADEYSVTTVQIISPQEVSTDPVFDMAYASCIGSAYNMRDLRKTRAYTPATPMGLSDDVFGFLAPYRTTTTYTGLTSADFRAAMRSAASSVGNPFRSTEQMGAPLRAYRVSPIRGCTLSRVRLISTDVASPFKIAAISEGSDFMTLQFRDIATMQRVMLENIKNPGYRVNLMIHHGSYTAVPYCKASLDEVRCSLYNEHTKVTPRAWYEVSKIIKDRGETRNVNPGPFDILAETPDINKVLYTYFPHLIKESSMYQFMLNHMFVGMIGADALQKEATVASVPVIDNYVELELTQNYKRYRIKSLKDTTDNLMATLRRVREDYAQRYREDIKTIKRQGQELRKIKNSPDKKLDEESRLADMMASGSIEGFRMMDNGIYVKTNEISIYETAPIFKIGKLAIQVENFTTCNPTYKFVNLTKTVATSYSNNHDHPHVRNGTGCHGNLEGLLQKAAKNQDLVTIILLCLGYLRSVNLPDTYGKTIYQWGWVLPTVHNLIKFGMVNSMSGTKLIYLRESAGFKKVDVVSYEEICAEFNAASKEITDLSKKDTDFRVKDLAVKARDTMCGFDRMIALNTGDGANDKIPVVTERSDAQITQSIGEFRNLIKSTESWTQLRGFKSARDVDAF
jgi:hypothetical protein